MATPKTADSGAPEKPLELAKETPRTYDPRKKVRVMDKESKTVVRRLVPETWLDGRFSNLVETPSQKVGN